VNPNEMLEPGIQEILSLNTITNSDVKAKNKKCSTARLSKDFRAYVLIQNCTMI
jgi:hypothetical protein